MAAETFLLLAIATGVTLYALLAGADFGAGIWQAISGGRFDDREREQVHAAVGPVWEANHVWLIFVLVLLFTAFPPAFAAIMRALWVPLLLAIAGIVLRGAGFAFRPRDPWLRGERRAWERVFAGASVGAPLFLGSAAGAIAEGRLRVTRTGAFEGGALDWLGPFPLYAGALGVGLCAHLAAVYLARESALSKDLDLERAWRRRALGSAIVVGVLALGGFGAAAGFAPELWTELRSKAWPFVLASAGAGVMAVAALVLRRPTVAAAAAMVSVATVLWGWFAARWPVLVPPIEARDAKAPEPVLEATAWCTAAGIAVTVPALLYLLRTFKSARAVARPRGEGPVREPLSATRR